ncbi:MAG TPA: cbb3-type cytochrome oxidase assembly protein CcoS [Steroidobacteraceae bacterium]
MNILYLLIPLGLVLVAIMVAAFFWATKSGQFDDLQTPAVQILLDDDSKPMRHDRKSRDA